MSFRHHVEFRASWGGQDWVLELWRSCSMRCYIEWYAPGWCKSRLLLYYTGSLETLVEPVDIETFGTQVFYRVSASRSAGVVGAIVRVV